jgi:hypothetical protein
MVPMQTPSRPVCLARHRHSLGVVDPEQKSILAGSPFEFHAGWNRIVRDGSLLPA